MLYNTGYWAVAADGAAARGVLPDVTLAESNIMPYICQPRGDAIHIGRFKRHFCVAAFPGDRSAAVYEVVSRIYSSTTRRRTSSTPISPPPAIRPST